MYARINMFHTYEYVKNESLATINHLIAHSIVIDAID